MKCVGGFEVIMLVMQRREDDGRGEGKMAKNEERWWGGCVCENEVG